MFLRRALRTMRVAHLKIIPSYFALSFWSPQLDAIFFIAPDAWFTEKQNIPSPPTSLPLFFSDFILRTVYARGTLLYKKKKKRNGARKWNIRVVKSGGCWIFIVYAMKPEYVAFESILGSFHHFEIDRLSLSAVSSGLYSRVTARIERKHSLSFSSRLVSSRGTFLPPLSRFTLPARFGSLRFIILVIVPSRELRVRVISRGYPLDWVAKRRFGTPSRARFHVRSCAN